MPALVSPPRLAGYYDTTNCTFSRQVTGAPLGRQIRLRPASQDASLAGDRNTSSHAGQGIEAQGTRARMGLSTKLFT